MTIASFSNFVRIKNTRNKAIDIIHKYVLYTTNNIPLNFDENIYRTIRTVSYQYFSLFLKRLLWGLIFHRDDYERTTRTQQVGRGGPQAHAHAHAQARSMKHDGEVLTPTHGGHMTLQKQTKPHLRTSF